jgi:hypothetical protein
MKYDRKKVMQLAWQFVRKNGYSFKDAMRAAWCNVKIVAEMEKRIVKFYFQKVDGTIREAFGTLMQSVIPQTTGAEKKRNDTVQTYYDTEKSEWRCFKKANLLKIA